MSKKIEFISFGELMKKLGEPKGGDEGRMEEALSLIKGATQTLSEVRSGDQPAWRIGSVTWRLADALFLISQMDIDEDLPGIRCPTGRGAILNSNEGDQ